MNSGVVEIGSPLSLSDLVAVARGQRTVALAAEARARIGTSRAAIDAIVAAGDSGPFVYGVNTGFGALAETRISQADIASLQRNLVRSHACGVGPALGRAEVRAMMVLRAQVVALGYSGVRQEVVDAQRRRRPARPFTGQRRRLGRSRAARPPGARAHGRG
jgi:histidine ammonia-lyase